MVDVFRGYWSAGGTCLLLELELLGSCICDISLKDGVHFLIRWVVMDMGLWK